LQEILGLQPVAAGLGNGHTGGTHE
jgi:hypothetical protein